LSEFVGMVCAQRHRFVRSLAIGSVSISDIASSHTSIATEVYKRFHQACRDVVKLSTRIFPERRRQQPYETTYRLYRKVYNNLLDVFENHAHSDS